jgi:predicted nucleic acid-binding protein
VKGRYLLDANVIVRFLADEPSEHLERSKQLVAKAENGECELILAPWIVAEVIFTAVSFYEMDKTACVEALCQFAGGSGIVLLDRDIVMDALDRYAHKNVDFADALLAAQAKAMGIQPASFDRDLDKFADVKRYEP